MSASTNSPLDAEAVKALIDQHAKNLAEACKQTAEACKSEAEAAVKKAVEAAREAAKAENAANLAKIESMITAALSKRPNGKGAVGNLDEHTTPKTLQPGMVGVPAYFKELAAAAEKKKAFDAAVHPGGLN